MSRRGGILIAMFSMMVKIVVIVMALLLILVMKNSLHSI
jgi:hypothetical protein